MVYRLPLRAPKPLAAAPDPSDNRHRRRKGGERPRSRPASQRTAPSVSASARQRDDYGAAELACPPPSPIPQLCHAVGVAIAALPLRRPALRR